MHTPGKIVQLNGRDTLPMHLLLLADETVEVIERYIYQCDVYILVREDAGTVGVFALCGHNAGEIELKNMAVMEAFQSRGFGSYMLGEVQRIAARGGYRRVIVGTATLGRQLHFYIKNGFSPYGVRKNFFLDNYPEPVMEEGERLCDMVLLEKGVDPL